MADDAVIGQVKVRVMPDTSKFAKDAKEGVEAKEKQKNWPKAKIQAKLDARDLAGQARDAVENLNDYLANTKKYRATYRVAISERYMTREVTAAHKKLQAIAKLKKPIDFEATLGSANFKDVVEALAKEAKKVKEELEEVKTLKLSVDADSNGSLKAAIARIDAELTKLRSVQVEVELNEEALEAERKRLQSKLKLELRYDNTDLKSVQRALKTVQAEAKKSTIDLKVGLDNESLAETAAELKALEKTLEAQSKIDLKASGLQAFMKFTGLRLGVGIFQHFRDFFSTIDKKVPLIGALTLATLGLSGAMLSAVGNTFSLSRALAQIGPGAVALPGIFAGIAIGLGATFAVFKDFNKELPSVGKRLSEIQDSMSEKFWDRARKPISEMVDVLLPKFARGLDGTARSLGTFFANLADSFKESLGGNAIARMFADLNSSIRIFARYTDDITELFRVFGEAGAGRLPELSRWVGKLTKQFSRFMREAEASGKIDHWINQSVERLQDLGRALRNGTRLFSGLARAADASSPGDALENLANALERAEKVVNRPAFQKTLTGVLTAAHEMMDNIGRESGPAFRKMWATTADLLIDVLPQIGTILGKLFDAFAKFSSSTAVQRGMRRLVDGIERGVDHIVPLWEILAEKSGAVMELIGEMADTFGKVFAASVKTLTPILTVFLKIITKIVQAVGSIPEPLIQVGIALGAAHLAFTRVNAVMFAMAPLVTTASASLSRLSGGLIATSAASNAATASLTRLSTLIKRGIVIGLATTVLDSVLPQEGLVRAAFDGFKNNIGDGFRTLGAVVTGQWDDLGSLWGRMEGRWDAAIGRATGAEEYTQEYIAQVNRAKDAGKAWKTAVEELQATLDAFNAARTGETRIKALDQLEQQLPGITTEMRNLGISERTLAMAALGNAQAISKVNALYANAGPLQQFKFGQHQISDALGNVTMKLGAAERQARRNIAVTQDLSGLMGRIPKNVYTQLELQGVEPSVRGIAKVAKQYKLVDKKHIKAIIDVLGVSASVKDVQRVINKLKETDGVKPNLKPYKDGIAREANAAAVESGRGSARIAKALKHPVEKARANLLGFNQSISNQLNNLLAPTARSGGSTVGTNLTAGVTTGIYDGSGPLYAASRDVIRTAIAEMNREADIRSPSRETAKVGRFMGEGLVIGLRKHGSKAGKAGAELVRAVLTDMDKAKATKVDGLVKALLKTLTDDRISKLEKKALTAQAGRVKGLAQKWLSVAQQIEQVFKDVTSAAAQFQLQVVTAIHELANPTAIEGAAEGMTFDAIQKNFEDAIDKAKRWSKAIAELKKLNLNSTLFQQILTAGPAAGLATAEAIAEAGKAGVAELNKQQAELNKLAQEAGKTAFSQHYENGLMMAKGLLAGLKSKQRELEQQMETLGTALAKSLKKALGIKSPSRVMRKIGVHTGEGFVLGVKDTKRDAETAIVGLSAVRPRAIEISRALERSGSSSTTNKTINYYAAPGSSLSSEESLFAAINRARSNGF